MSCTRGKRQELYLQRQLGQPFHRFGLASYIFLLIPAFVQILDNCEIIINFFIQKNTVESFVLFCWQSSIHGGIKPNLF